MTEITSRLVAALADRYRIESRLAEGGGCRLRWRGVTAANNPVRALRVSKGNPRLLIRRTGAGSLQAP